MDFVITSAEELPAKIPATTVFVNLKFVTAHPAILPDSPRQSLNAREILEEFSVDALTAEQVVKLLCQRVDLK